MIHRISARRQSFWNARHLRLLLAETILFLDIAYQYSSMMPQLLLMLNIGNNDNIVDR